MANEIDSQHGTLTASTVATVTIKADHGETILVLNRGSSDIYLRLDGVDPVVAANDTSIVPAGDGRTYSIKGTNDTLGVKLISSGTPAYSVETY